MDFDELLLAIQAQHDSDQIAELESAALGLAIEEQAQVFWLDRLRGTRGDVQILLVGGMRVTGRVAEISREWFAIAGVDFRVQTTVVNVAAVISVRHLARQIVPTDGSVFRELSWLRVLRGVAKSQIPVRIVTSATVLDCIIVRVLADHIDVVHRDAESIRLDGGRPQIEAVMLATVLAFEYGSQEG